MVDLARITKLKGAATEKVERQKQAAPNYGRIRPSLFAKKGANGTPFVTTGPILKDSEGYSVNKAFRFASRQCGPELAKEELYVAQKMANTYGHLRTSAESFFIVTSADPMYHRHFIQETGDTAFIGELRQKMHASVAGADPDEIRHYSEKSADPDYVDRYKTIGTFPATAGGSFVPPPTLMQDVIQLQRNAEVFSRSGAMEVPFSPQGANTWPRQTGASTSYWVGEAAPITESTPATGALELRAKKLGTLVTLNQEAMLFSNPSLEAMTRNDMALNAALTADLAMLQGTGGTQIKGLTTYTADTNAYLNIQTMLASTVTAAGNTFQANDIMRAFALLPDVIADVKVRWVMNPALFAPIMNRSADAVTAGDQAGPYKVNLTRTNGERIGNMLNGETVVRSRQVATTRTNGTGGTNLTYAILGHFPDWIIARYGVQEVLMNPYATTPYVQAQTQLRAIQYIDGGPRTPNSFIFIDNLIQQ